MPAWIVFGERNSLSLYGMADDRGWTVVIERKALEDLSQLTDVMPIDLYGCKTESLPLVH
jgi:hypothetical protein